METEFIETEPPPELEELRDELKRARAKFPDPRLMLCALAEELGEAVRSEDPYYPGNVEWLQVACCAIRLHTEGDPAAVVEAADLRLCDRSGEHSVRDPSCPLGWIEEHFKLVEQIGRRTMADVLKDERHAREGGHES